MALPASAIGILGGTFDPVHNAHLEMARAAMAHLPLRKLLFIPTGTPRYRKAPVASPEDRIAMLRLAIAGEPRYEIDTRELAPDASGYTVDTLSSLKGELGAQTDLYLLMGADQYEKLENWHRPQEVARLAKIAVFGRPGIELKENVNPIPMAPMPVSASEIRARARLGESLDGLVPPAVANYIGRHGLYS
jgi:nicotinate-nucleotide adenylyltransferase